MAIWAYKAVMSCKKTPEQWLAEIHQRVETQPAGTLKWITAIQEDAERNPLKRIAELEKDLEAANRLAFEYSQKMPTTAQAMVYQNLLEKYNAVKEDGKRVDELARLLRAAEKYVPAGAFLGNIMEKELAEIQLCGLIEKALVGTKYAAMKEEMK